MYERASISAHWRDSASGCHSRPGEFYSSRSACPGSILAAFRTGNRLASSPARTKVATVTESVIGSSGRTPYRTLFMMRVDTRASGMPAMIPTAIRSTLSRRNKLATSIFCAPSANRNPISRVRRETA